MNNDDINTKPTIETVLERVNELGEQLTGQLTELRNGQAELRSEVAELRAGQMELRSDVATMKGDLADLNVGQRKIVHKIEILNNTILTVQTDLRADIRAFDRRLEKLESQPS
jgi:chromosome segregation ATPase